MSKAKVSNALLPSNHFDGKRFHNQYPAIKDRSLKEVLKWMTSRKPSKWPRHLNIQPKKVPTERVYDGTLRATFINHSTVLLQVQGMNILTDPIWSERCSPFKWLGPKRVISPGIRFEDLPPIDLVLLSHNHYDHMDLPTLKRLNQVHHPEIFVSKGNRPLLVRNGILKVIEFDWWQERKVTSHLKITFVPAQHFANRGVMDRNMTLWGGFVLEGRMPTIFFAGDTGYGTHFKLIREKFGSIGLSLLPIGAYKPEWFMKSVHMSPFDAVQAHLDLESKQSIGIHFGTFQLSDEKLDSPINDLAKAIEQNGIEKDSIRSSQSRRRLNPNLLNKMKFLKKLFISSLYEIILFVLAMIALPKLIYMRLVYNKYSSQPSQAIWQRVSRHCQRRSLPHLDPCRFRG